MTNCNACSNTPSPSYTATCSGCASGFIWNSVGNTCDSTCQTYDTVNTTACTKCVTGYIVSSGTCVTTCPSGTSADSTNTTCVSSNSSTSNASSSSNSTLSNQNGCNNNTICVERLYWSWMTIVVGVTDGVVVLAILAHFGASIFGTSFFTSS